MWIIRNVGWADGVEPYIKQTYIKYIIINNLRTHSWKSFSFNAIPSQLNNLKKNYEFYSIHETEAFVIAIVNLTIIKGYMFDRKLLMQQVSSLHKTNVDQVVSKRR